MILLSIIAGAGALQGLSILISMILRQRHSRNLPLALLITVFSLRLATIPTWNYDVLLNRVWLWPVTTALPFLFAPLVWWHIRDMATGDHRALSGLKLHCLPWFAEVLLLCVTLFPMAPPVYESFLSDVFSGHPPLWLPLRNGLKVLVNIIYMTMAAFLAFGKGSGQRSRAKRLWMRSLVIVPFIVLASFSIVALFPSRTVALSEGNLTPFFILSIFMSSLIFITATFFMICPELFTISDKIAESGDKQFPEEKCRELQKRLERRMAEGVFRDPDLSLPDLAAEFGVNNNLLSHTVNCYCGRGFRSYLNGKRLAYFLEELEKGKKRSLLELAFDAGFSSKSTFNRVFHEETGMTPTEYLRTNESE